MCDDKMMIDFQNIKIYQMSCCPKGSWEQLQDQYKTVGEDLSIEGVPVYHSGKGDRFIVIVSDIFGANSGRHRNVADIFASLGYNVYLPEFLVTPFDGPIGPAIMDNIKGQDMNIMNAKYEKVINHLAAQGAEKTFSIGFCWGVWYAFKLSAKYGKFIAIAGPHPSLQIEQWFGGNQLQLTNSITCPTFLLPAANDPSNVKHNGQLVNLLAAKFPDQTGTFQFPSMQHGWVVRGDMSDPTVSHDVNKAIELIHDYFSKFK